MRGIVFAVMVVAIACMLSWLVWKDDFIAAVKRNEACAESCEPFARTRRKQPGCWCDLKVRRPQ